MRTLVKPGLPSWEKYAVIQDEYFSYIVAFWVQCVFINKKQSPICKIIIIKNRILTPDFNTCWSENRIENSYFRIHLNWEIVIIKYEIFWIQISIAKLIELHVWQFPYQKRKVSVFFFLRRGSSTFEAMEKDRCSYALLNL